MSDSVWVVGAAMTGFRRYADKDVIDLAAEAARAALADASVSMDRIGLVATGNVAEGAVGIGQRLMRQIGQTGAPVYNVANACATGASAVRIAHMAIASGEADLALAVGAEQMGKTGLLGAASNTGGPERFEPSGRYGAVVPVEGVLGTSLMPGVFAQAGMEYANTHGVTATQFARVAEKNHLHSTLNPLSMYQKSFSLEEILNAEMIAYPNTVLMCCPSDDGAAALVLASGAAKDRLDPAVRRRAVKISAAVLTTDPYVDGGQVQPDINTLTRRAAALAYQTAGIEPSDLDLVELHDCFATAELVHYDNLGLCEPGGAGDFIDSGAPYRDGRLPVNVSGGLLSKGHPIGATGVAGIYEVATQLRGEAGPRQLEGASVGMAHVLGLGSACAVHILEKGAVA